MKLCLTLNKMRATIRNCFGGWKRNVGNSPVTLPHPPQRENLVWQKEPELVYPPPLTSQVQMPSAQEFINNPKRITPETLMAYALHPKDLALIAEVDSELTRLVSLAGGEALSLGSTARGTFLPSRIDFDVMNFSPSPLSTALAMPDRFVVFPDGLDKLHNLLTQFVKTFYEGRPFELVVRRKFPDWRYCRFSLDIKLPTRTVGLADINYIDTSDDGSNSASRRYFLDWQSSIRSLDPVQKERLFRNVRLARHILPSLLASKTEAMYVEQMVLQSNRLLRHLVENYGWSCGLQLKDLNAGPGSFDDLLEYIYCREACYKYLGKRQDYWESMILTGFNFEMILQPNCVLSKLTSLYHFAAKYHQAKLNEKN